jgi:thioredoxin 1
MRKLLLLGSMALLVTACTPAAPAPSAPENTTENQAVAPEIDQKLRENASQATMSEGGEGEMVNDTAMMQKEGEADGAMMKKDVVKQASQYTAYTADILNNGQTKVLFFHASWCPACKKADADLQVIYSGSVAPGKSTYKVDYDTSAELKQKYGVTSQHTFVVVDGEGNMISTITGATKEQLEALVK